MKNDSEQNLAIGQSLARIQGYVLSQFDDKGISVKEDSIEELARTSTYGVNEVIGLLERSMSGDVEENLVSQEFMKLHPNEMAVIFVTLKTITTLVNEGVSFAQMAEIAEQSGNDTG